MGVSSGTTPELTQQFLGLAVLVEVDEPVGQPVSGRELEQPFGVRGVTRADDPKPAAEFDQQRPPHEVRAKDQVTEHWIAEDELPQ